MSLARVLSSTTDIKGLTGTDGGHKFRACWCRLGKMKLKFHSPAFWPQDIMPYAFHIFLIASIVLWACALGSMWLLFPHSGYFEFRKEYAKKESVLNWVTQGFYFAFFGLQIASFEFTGETQRAIASLAVVCIISYAVFHGLRLWNESAFLGTRIPHRYLVGLALSFEMLVAISIALFFYVQIQTSYALGK